MPAARLLVELVADKQEVTALQGRVAAHAPRLYLEAVGREALDEHGILTRRPVYGAAATLQRPMHRSKPHRLVQPTVASGVHDRGFVVSVQQDRIETRHIALDYSCYIVNFYLGS